MEARYPILSVLSKANYVPTVCKEEDRRKSPGFQTLTGEQTDVHTVLLSGITTQNWKFLRAVQHDRIVNCYEELR